MKSGSPPPESRHLHAPLIYPPSVTIRKMPCILARPHRNLFIQQDLQFICTIS